MAGIGGRSHRRAPGTAEGNSLTEPLNADELTRLLNLSAEGDDAAREQALELVYDALKGVARVRMAGQRADHSLQATGLVHEAFVKLFGRPGARWSNRKHFFLVAARAMEQILIDDARRKGRKKRTAPGEREPVDHVADRSLPWPDRSLEEAMDLREALVELAVEHGLAADIARLRSHCGLGMDEIADVLGVPKRTVEREWQFARVWLKRRLD